MDTKNVIKIIKSKYKLKQIDLADLLQVEPITINRWAHGKNEPSPKYLNQLKDLLDSGPNKLSKDLTNVSTDLLLKELKKRGFKVILEVM